VEGLSGGERRRLALAALVASKANVLILDEPTNHLDLESREALEDALRAFEGSVLLVSHDRALLDAVGTRTVAVEDGTLRMYRGGWAEYLRVREERRARDARPEPAADGAVKPRDPRAARRAERAAERAGKAGDRARLERELEAAESTLREVEAELSDPHAWETPERAADSTERYEEAQRTVDALYERWDAAG
ncbi:MAG: ATP-binding cassette, subfamily er 3, partial [Solirubrobacteraceae bacterium]|nr:ATP-binding cassette, subfamily er 3 [Solirubrobacteraceae bacterium]